MERARTGGIRAAARVTGWALALLGCGAGLAVGQEAAGSGRIAVDRWLVSSPFPVASDEDPLTTDRLSAPGEVGVLPDRGRTVAGADWTLVRHDSSLVLDLEDRGAEAEGPVVVYAHAYLRSAQDRTVSLHWGGVDCTGVRAWLNGRSLDGLSDPAEDEATERAGPFQAPVRIGHGYNTLLLKAVSGDCAFGIVASIEPAEVGGSLKGVRVQASRPYGDTRTGPAPWVLADPDAGPEPILGWTDGQLYGAAGVRLAAFAVTAVEGAELKAKVRGEQVERSVGWLTPAEPETLFMPFPFETLREAGLRGEGMEIELDWGEGKTKQILRLDPTVLLQALHGPIRLLGWTVTAGGEGTPAETAQEEADLRDSGGNSHPLAHLVPLPGPGVTLAGEWEVPGWLSGFTLELDAAGAPGEYRLDSNPVEGDRVRLCTDCRKGSKVRLTVRSTGDWERFPAVRVVGVAPPEVPGQVEAAGWLKLMDEKGNREYRQRLEASP
jgi:hypothetical protein